MPGRTTHGARARRIYWLDPHRAGPFADWPSLLEQVQQLGFDAVLLPPPFATDGDDPTLVHDHAQAPRWLDDADALGAIERVARACREAGLALLVDLPLDRVAVGGALQREQPGWFVAAAAPDAEPPDPRRGGPTRGVATLRWHVPAVANAAVDWLRPRIATWAAAGIAGFRCLAPHRVPPQAWQEISAAVRRQSPRAQMLAWTPGLDAGEVGALRDCGFDATFLSLPWWNFRDAWLVEEHARLAAVAPPIAPVALTSMPAGAGAETSRTRALRALWAAAALGNGVLVPHGFECEPDGSSDPARCREVKAANALAGSFAKPACRLRAATGPDAPLTAIAREGNGTARLVVLNAADDAIGAIDAAHVLAHVACASARYAALHPRRADALSPAASVVLEPGAVHVYEAEALAPVRIDAPAVTGALQAPRIAIDDVSPSVDGGRFPAKRIVGERVRVEADVYSDGHGQLGVELAWRRADEQGWQRVRMAALGNDRWGGDFPLERLGRHEFLVEAWQDRFATLRGDLEKKQAAGVDTSVDLADAVALLSDVLDAAADVAMREALAALLARYRGATPEAQVALLLAPETATLMAQADPRPFRVASAIQPVDAERLAARFASWYELFPRSQSGDAHRHGSFDDVVARLPAIRAMGFDVLYMPPIHPIGKRNRKGRNNSLVAQPDDPGSPYAIGSAEGGHDAIHPELGTFAGFQRLVAAAAAHGLEVALDFAIQCSPDHPWLAQHPEWFAWRADGSIRYAENPPKKYEDIVNVEFHAPGAMPALWLALRDVVLFWVSQGVRLFRVDNPHTKPFPFWEWLIADVRSRDPGVVFLAEAFTRPNPMYRLAKLGFSQSYTYFTWRNTKAELANYLQELADTDVREYYRPHFFVNTPDINPWFLQRSGRAGFLIRAALATTLSGLWGMYQGFELCEAAAVPGKEEYLDSEKYELRAWSERRPGDIVDEVTRLNHIRRANPALHTHRGVRFHRADNDQVLFFSKRTPALDNVVLVAVSLDPHAAQEAGLELPWWELGLPEHGAIAMEDLVRETRLEWHGARRRVRLEPQLPYAIWRVAARRDGK